eukprot:g5004.t1
MHSQPFSTGFLSIAFLNLSEFSLIARSNMQTRMVSNVVKRILADMKLSMPWWIQCEIVLSVPRIVCRFYIIPYTGIRHATTTILWTLNVIFSCVGIHLTTYIMNLTHTYMTSIVIDTIGSLNVLFFFRTRCPLSLLAHPPLPEQSNNSPLSRRMYPTCRRGRAILPFCLSVLWLCFFHLRGAAGLVPQEVSTLAGSPTQSGSTDGVGNLASFFSPSAVAASPEGSTLYVADTNNHVLRTIDINSRQVALLAGKTGAEGYLDGFGAKAQFNRPVALSLSADGTKLFVAEPYNNVIRQITPSSGKVSTLAGTAMPDGAGSEDGVGGKARFWFPVALCSNPTGSKLYVADRGNRRIRAIDVNTKEVSTLTGTAQYSSQTIPNATRGYAIELELNIQSLASILAGQVWVAGNMDGALETATFDSPCGLARSPDGRMLYVTTEGSHTIRAIDLRARSVSTVAGQYFSWQLYGGYRDGVGKKAQFRSPSGPTLSADGASLFLADRNNHVIRKINLAPSCESPLEERPGVPYACPASYYTRPNTVCGWPVLPACDSLTCCLPFLCLCPNGTPTSGSGQTDADYCQKNGTTDCAACEPGFKLSAPAGSNTAYPATTHLPAAQCVCPDGVGAVGDAAMPEQRCMVDGQWIVPLAISAISCPRRRARLSDLPFTSNRAQGRGVEPSD